MEIGMGIVVWIASAVVSCHLVWRADYLISYRYPELGTPEEQWEQEGGWDQHVVWLCFLIVCGPIGTISCGLAHLLHFNRQWHEETAAKRRAEGYDE